MRIRQRAAISIAVVVLLSALVVLARIYGPRRAAAALRPQQLLVNVVTGADRGAGSLREALFMGDAAPGPARIVVHVRRITLDSALPPIVNPHGVELVVPDGTVEIDAHALSAGSPVFDVDAEHASLSGLSIRHCAGTAILVRAARFRLSSSLIESCDVGVEVAGRGGEIALERNQFLNNRVGIRFSAPSRDSVVVKNQFTGNSDAGVWIVASQPAGGSDTISVHDNQFNGDRTDIVLGNIPAVIEQNNFTSVRDAAVHVIGAQAVVRNNRITTGAASGIIVENAPGAVIDGNELDHLQGYGILVRDSSDTLVRDNRIHSCGYGMAFVLGDPHHPDTAVNNTLFDLQYNGVDVIGSSPVLRGNRVLQARVMPLHVVNFSAPGREVVRAQPLLEKNSFQAAGPIAAHSAAQR